MYAASLNINTSMVLPGLARAVDVGLLSSPYLSQGKDAACRAEGPGTVCPQKSSGLSKLILPLLGPGNKATNIFAPAPIVPRLHEKALLDVAPQPRCDLHTPTSLASHRRVGGGEKGGRHAHSVFRAVTCECVGQLVQNAGGPHV